MCNEREYWTEQLEGVLECYSDEYAEETGINKLTEDDKINITDEIMNDGYLWSTIDSCIMEIIERYCAINNKNEK